MVYLHGFQPAVDEAVEQEAADRAFDVGTAVELLPIAAEDAHDHVPGEDEHAEEAGGRIRTSGSTRCGFAAIADALAERLARPIRRTPPTTRPGPSPLHPELDTLDAEFAAGLRDLRSGARSSPATPRSTTWPTGTT